MSKTHIVAIPYPAQGHVIPMMELSQCLVNHGFKVTFVNTEFNHKRVMNARHGESDTTHTSNDQINHVPISDGLELWEDRNDLGKLSEAIQRVMPVKLQELIESINKVEGEKVTCVIADESCGWALEVARKMQTRQVVAFWPASAAALEVIFCIPKYIQDGIIHKNGAVMKSQMLELAPNMPTMKTTDFIWASIGDTTTQKIIFQVMQTGNNTVKLADKLICNSAFDLEPAAFNFTEPQSLTLSPTILPIGPLLAGARIGGEASGSFWKEDSTCLAWLDQHPPSSVIYVAFGSFTVFDQKQFQELALALEQCNRPFLWIVRQDISQEATQYFPKGYYKETVGSKGLMVGWVPQQKVLEHSSVGCFLSHCGWNSTLEGVSNGVPFLCWPYFADQFLNESYICDIWKVGLRLDKNSESGIIEKEEIKSKVEEIFSDEGYRARASKLKEVAMMNVQEGGKSNVIFKEFVEWLKA